jgi:hypothetical protein
MSNKSVSTQLRRFATARGLSLIAHGNRQYSVFGAQARGPACADEIHAWLAEIPTLSRLRAKAAREANLPSLHQMAQRKKRFGLAAPLYEPEDGETPPPGLRGLHIVTVLLPPGADGDDALRGLWRAEDHVKRRGCPAVAERLGDAREAIASGVLAPVEIVCSDHDLVSVDSYCADIGVVMLAGYLAGAALVRGRHGPRNKKIPGLWAV